MGVGTIIHYFGSLVLFVAMVLTIVVDITSPTVRNLSFVNLDLEGENDATFGAFGYCWKGGQNNRDWTCSDTSIGYNPVSVLNTVDAATYSNIRADTARALTKVFILHPISTVLLGISFLLSLLNSSTLISLLATLTSALSFVICAIAVIIDFVAFRLLLSEINDADGNGEGKYGSAVWLALVAAIGALIGTIIMFVTCCAGRRRRKRESRKSAQY